MKYLIIIASLFIISCWNDEVINNNWNPEDNAVQETDNIPQGYADWWPSELCNLEFIPNKLLYLDEYSNLPGLQARFTIRALGTPVPEKVTFLFNGKKVGYTGQVNGEFGLILTLPKETTEIRAVADNCEDAISFYDVWEQEDGGNLKIPKLNLPNAIDTQY